MTTKADEEAMEKALTAYAFDVDDYTDEEEESGFRAGFRAGLAHARQSMQGHAEPCYYCGATCDSLAGNPGKWPVALTHADEPGVVKWHHVSCVSERLLRNEWRRLTEDPSTWPDVSPCLFVRMSCGILMRSCITEGDVKTLARSYQRDGWTHWQPVALPLPPPPEGEG